VDPVSLGICSQLDLDLAVQKAASKGRGKRLPDAEEVRTLIPASEIQGTRAYETAAEETKSKPSDEIDADSVFAKLKGLSSK
jgi:hypothetical protein